ncbi:caldesmon isoform X7 [Columba livia]|uniref:caldesmon isoform X7 n=1 Tax=Columba livia TaxID=8932 RepID=UPI0031BB5E84
MDDFERRRELRRQKREEMRLEAERLSYQRNDDDEEEAARERRRRARQERLRQKEEGDLSGEVTEKSENAQNSVAEEETKRTTTTAGTDDEAALLERLARREERRQKRLQEALERQKEFDPTITDGSLSLPSRREVNNVEENETTGKEEKAETRRGCYEIEETETVTKSYQRNNWRQDGEEEEKKEGKDKEEVQEEKPKEVPIEENQVKDDKDKGKAPKDEMKSIWDRKKGIPEQKAQNGERELAAPKLKSTENAFGRSNLKGTANVEEAKLGSKEKQQEAAAELDELKKRREERRKIMEEEEQKKKQEEAERKAREEEEKKRMKEEIERRRAEAAEKRQKVPEDGVSEDKKPFKCFSPKGSSLKIEERAEFLNKSAQKSGMKPTHTTGAVSKIDSRLEQYTSAVVGTKAARPAKPAASDLPLPAEGVRNIKSMWEKGNVFSSPSGTGTPNKETAGLKVGVSSRINEWLTKTPESNKSPAPKPSDLKPGDVSSKRNLWEKQSVDKPAASSKVSAMGKKSETNAGLRQFEKEP